MKTMRVLRGTPVNSFAFPRRVDFKYQLLETRFLSCSSSSSSVADEDVRVRFAPSPTGFLHLGGLRTALYNFLFARKNGGKFILRVEDTDQTRVVPGALDAMITDLKWTGIAIDEGPGSVHSDGSLGPVGPYIQSERVSIYKEKGEEIVQRGGAYRCFCTEHRLELMRKDAARRNEHLRGYDNRCRHLSSAEISARLRDEVPHVIRLHIKDDTMSYDDLIYGPRSENISTREGDPVLIKTDGYPTYHFANVVDDHLMRVTHVLRGAEWISSTAKHLLLYKEFGWIPPRFAHLPLIMNSDGKKLSKRHDHLRVSSLRTSGYTPESLLTFLCSIGGGILPRNSYKEHAVYSSDSLVEAFYLENLTKGTGSLSFDLLNLYSRSHLQDLMDSPSGQDRVLGSFKDCLAETRDDHLSIVLEDDEELKRVIRWSLDRIHVVKDLIHDPDLQFLWRKPSLDFSSIAEVLAKADISVLDLTEILRRVEIVIRENRDLTVLNGELKKLTKKGSSLQFKELMSVTRWCLTADVVGPPVFEIIDIIGKDKALERLRLAVECLNVEIDSLEEKCVET